MYELALVYVKRCQIAKGTARYTFLKKRADELIATLESKEQLNDLLQYSSLDFSLEVSNPNAITHEFFKERASGQSFQEFDTLDRKIAYAVLQELENGVTALIDALHELYQEYAILHILDKQGPSEDILEVYETIEVHETEISRSLAHLQSLKNEYGVTNKESELLPFLQTLFYLISEYPPEYALRHVKFIPHEAHEIPVTSLFRMINVLIYGKNIKFPGGLQKKQLLHDSIILQTTTPNIFYALLAINQNYQIQCMRETNYLFLYADAVSCVDHQQILDALLYLEVIDLSDYASMMQTCTRALLLKNPILFRMQYIEPFRKGSTEAFKKAASMAFIQYKQSNPQALYACWWNHIQEVPDNQKLPYEIIDSLDELKTFHAWVLCKNISVSDKNDLLYYAYHTMVKCGANNMQDPFVKTLMDQYHKAFGSNFSLFNVSSHESTDSLNEIHESPLMTLKTIKDGNQSPLMTLKTFF